MFALAGEPSISTALATSSATDRRPDGVRSQSELADGTSVDPANLVETLDGLEAEGLVRRDVDSDDRRRRRISLTPAGRRKLQAGMRAAEQVDKDVLGALEGQELDSLRDTVLRAYRSTQSGP